MLLGMVLFAEILDQGSTRIVPLVTWIAAGGVDVHGHCGSTRCPAS